MTVPNFQKMMLPALKAYAGEKELKVSDIETQVAKELNLSQDQCTEILPSGLETTLHNRIGWAVFDLFQAGLLDRPKRGYYKITPSGQSLLKQNLPEITRDFLKKYPSFLDFLNRSNSKKSIAQNTENDVLEKIDPETQLALSFECINNKLEADLLEELKHTDPVYFERIILDLFEAMNYGACSMTQKSHDGGIDGIIDEDTLGLSKIFMQAKRYGDNRVNEKEIQNFVGALACSTVTKGIFVTTSFFDEKAKKKAADASKKGMIVRLVNGEELAKLMIAHNIGVRTVKTVPIKMVDSTYFSNDDF